MADVLKQWDSDVLRWPPTSRGRPGPLQAVKKIETHLVDLVQWPMTDCLNTLRDVVQYAPRTAPGIINLGNPDWTK